MIGQQEEFLIRLAMDLVKPAARSAVRSSIFGDRYPIEDIEASGMYGLVLAASRWSTYCEKKGYDHTRTDMFRLYAHRTIAGEIKEAARRHHWVSKAGVEAYRETKDVVAAVGGRSDAELAEALREAGSRVKPARARDVCAAMSTRFVSLQVYLPGSDGSNNDVWGDIDDPGQDVGTDAHRVAHAVEKYFLELSDSDRDVFNLSFVCGRSNSEVAKMVGSTTKRTSEAVLRMASDVRNVALLAVSVLELPVG
jgi:RNA polymerase sigma factor (sigma-70 family)